MLDFSIQHKGSFILKLGPSEQNYAKKIADNLQHQQQILEGNSSIIIFIFHFTAVAIIRLEIKSLKRLLVLYIEL